MKNKKKAYDNISYYTINNILYTSVVRKQVYTAHGEITDSGENATSAHTHKHTHIHKYIHTYVYRLSLVDFTGYSVNMYCYDD